MVIQKEACPWCDHQFKVDIEASSVIYSCDDCGKGIKVIRDTLPTLIAKASLESARSDLDDYDESLKEGLPVNPDARKDCQKRIESLRRELGYVASPST